MEQKVTENLKNRASRVLAIQLLMEFLQTLLRKIKNQKASAMLL